MLHKGEFPFKAGQDHPPQLENDATAVHDVAAELAHRLAVWLATGA